MPSDSTSEEEEDEDTSPVLALRERDRKGEIDFKHVGLDELPVALDRDNPDGLFYQPIVVIHAGVNASNEISPIRIDDDRRIDVASSYGVATAIEIDDTDGIAGNVPHAVGTVNEIWEIRSLSITSNAGATYDVKDDGVVVSEGVVVGAAATGELVSVAAIPVAGASAITITNGAAADTWNIRAIRLL